MQSIFAAVLTKHEHVSQFRNCISPSVVHCVPLLNSFTSLLTAVSWAMGTRAGQLVAIAIHTPALAAAAVALVRAVVTVLVA